MEKAIPPEELALMKRWVDTWKYVTGPALEGMKQEKLRAMTEEEAFDQAVMLSTSAADVVWVDPKRATADGLTEQQRLFQLKRPQP